MVFPLGDDNSDRTSFPLVNLVLIALNVFVFVVLQGMGNNHDFTLAWATVPAEITSGEDKVTEDRVVRIPTEFGPQDIQAPGLRPTPVSVYLTLLVSMFMHGGIAHLAGNLWFLWVFGDNIEDDLGPPRYVIFYLLAGLIASIVHVIFNSGGEAAMIPCLGASGAISGVMGAYLIQHPRRRVTVLLGRAVTQVNAMVAVGIWFVFQVVSGLGMLGSAGGGGVAYGAHIGGFIAGAALIKLFVIGKPPRDGSPLPRILVERSERRPGSRQF